MVDNISLRYGAVNNAGTYTWKDLFGNVHPRELNSDRTQLTLAAIYCAINTYIGAITSLPRFCQKIDPATQRPLKFVKTTDHPASRIWSHYANDELSSNDLLKMMVYDVLFQDGNFYALPEYDSLNRIARLHYIHPSRIPRGNITRSEGSETLSNGRKAAKGKLLYRIIASSYRETEAPEEFLLSRDEIIHIKGIIPDAQYFRSQGILESNARSAGLYDASEEMGSKFYSRGYTNQMFLSTEHQLSLKARKDLEEALNNTVTGGHSIEDIFKTKILEHGLKPVHVGMPLQAMQFIETRAFSVEDVARWFNMPAFLLHSSMGTGQAPQDSDKLMVMWIQNGLGHQLNNLAEQFRDQLLPRASQPLFRFEFQRLHLYKTILNDFSQALRNVFEIGGIDRLDLASLLGIHLDPTDPTNTQRYVPANLLTVDHSLLLEKKAETSITQMEEAIATEVQGREIAKDTHENPPPPPPIEDDGEPGPSDGGEDPERDQGESGKDNKTKAVPTPTDNIVKLALYNTLHGLHEYELRVMDQKRKSRPDDFGEAMEEWYPKFHSVLKNKLEPWKPIFDELGIDYEDTLNSWITMDLDLSWTPEQQAANYFKNSFSFLKV
jgi:HK97 family phage portal protein